MNIGIIGAENSHTIVVAKLLNVDRRIRGATVTHMIQSLEEQGMVQRVPDPADARARRVSLTPAGREAAAIVQQTWDELERRMSAVLTGPQARRLADLLAMVIDELAAQPAAVQEDDN